MMSLAQNHQNQLKSLLLNHPMKQLQKNLLKLLLCQSIKFSFKIISQIQTKISI